MIFFPKIEGLLFQGLPTVHRIKLLPISRFCLHGGLFTFACSFLTTDLA